MTRAILQPPGWVRPRGYVNGIAASGRFVFTAGVLGWNAEEKFEHHDFVGQFRQALINIRAILAEGGAAPADIVRMTCYVADKDEYIAARPAMGAVWREIFGNIYTCMALVQVAALVDEGARIEIETTAVVAEG